MQKLLQLNISQMAQCFSFKPSDCFLDMFWPLHVIALNELMDVKK